MGTTGRGKAALEHDAIARRVRACPACEKGRREGGDYVQLLRFAVKQCEGVAMLPCCTVLWEVGQWMGREEVRPLHSRGHVTNLSLSVAV